MIRLYTRGKDITDDDGKLITDNPRVVRNAIAGIRTRALTRAMALAGLRPAIGEEVDLVIMQEGQQRNRFTLTTEAGC